jgi:16S rRNA (guanine527-N7)-methyltransferase
VPDWFAELLERELRRWVSLSEDQVTRLRDHYELLQRWNRKINLTSVEPGVEMVLRHYCESLFFGAHLPEESASLVDIGSGAGFPGIPIAVLKPSWRVTLVESNQRKAVFLREATRGWSNVSVLSRRAEQVSERFDWLVSRAVDPKDLMALVPQVASRIGLMLGEDDFFELQKGSGIAWSEPIRLPWGDRRLCVFGDCST